MAQFDVHRNPGKNHAVTPYVVVVQSSLHEAYSRRVVIPLVRKNRDVPAYAKRMNPTFSVEGVAVVLDTLDIVTVSIDKLGEPIASLHDFGDDIIAAVDALITRAYD